MTDMLDELILALQRVSSEVGQMVDATAPDREIKVDPRFLQARVDRWNEALGGLNEVLKKHEGARP